MVELTESNTIEYLRGQGFLAPQESARPELLGWGVSNLVLRVFRPDDDDFVIKQSRVQLRTPDPWFSRLDRIFREMDLLKLLVTLLPAGVIPHVLLEDRENYLFAMEAVPADHIVWKQALLEGTADQQVAARLGEYLAAVHSGTAYRPDLQSEWGDTEVFDQLRLDPFYRKLAEKFPEFRAHLEETIASLTRNSVCVVLADFSPKNILLSGDRITLVDFETGHYGDPAFDLGFFLSHLLLKTVLHRDRFDDYAALTTQFWGTYLAGMKPVEAYPELTATSLQRRTWSQLAGCMWARIDATSKVDYLKQQAEQDAVRTFCQGVYREPPDNWTAALARLRSLTDEI